MAYSIVKAKYLTKCDGETLRKAVDKVKKGFIYNAQDLTDILEKDNLWEKGDDNSKFSIKDEYPSPVTYNNKQYDFYDVWESGEKNPNFFLLVEHKNEI